MYTITKPNHAKASLLINDRGQVYNLDAKPLQHAERIKQELQALGVTKYALLRAPCRHLPNVIHADEHIGGVVYGKHDDNFAMLVATDRRVIFLDKHPFFINEDELAYYVVSGVSFSHAGIGSTVTLHTRIKDFPIRTYNQQCAQGFVSFIESRCLEQQANTAGQSV